MCVSVCEDGIGENSYLESSAFPWKRRVLATNEHGWPFLMGMVTQNLLNHSYTSAHVSGHGPLSSRQTSTIKKANSLKLMLHLPPLPSSLCLHSSFSCTFSEEVFPFLSKVCPCTWALVSTLLAYSKTLLLCLSPLLSPSFPLPSPPLPSPLFLSPSLLSSLFPSPLL